MAQAMLPIVPSAAAMLLLAAISGPVVSRRLCKVSGVAHAASPQAIAAKRP